MAEMGAKTNGGEDYVTPTWAEWAWSLEEYQRRRSSTNCVLLAKYSIMKIIIILLLLSPILVNAQKTDDTKIIVTLNDNNEIYKKVKIALVDLDFIVKDNYNTDTLTTYPREFSKIPGLCRLTAVITGNTVSLTGVYGLIKIDDFGYTRSPKDFQKIIYYKGSKGWELLKTVAERIGGKIAFSK
jgi:hypothetical protein